MLNHNLTMKNNGSIRLEHAEQDRKYKCCILVCITVCVCVREKKRGRQLMLWLFPLVSAVPSFFYAPTVVEPQHEAPPGSKNRKRKKPGLCNCVCVCFHSKQTSCNKGRVLKGMKDLMGALCTCTALLTLAS